MKAQIGLMIEGQFGLNWDRWRRILAMAERAGYQCVFRSDHFTNPAEPDLDSLELFTSLTFAATATSRIEFGSLVAPVTFRHPTMTVRQAAQIDDLSGGRLLVFSQGTLREGTWTKAGPSEPSRWLDQDGSYVVLPPGPVWVEVLPQTGEIELR